MKVMKIVSLFLVVNLFLIQCTVTTDRNEDEDEESRKNFDFTVIMPSSEDGGPQICIEVISRSEESQRSYKQTFLADNQGARFDMDNPQCPTTIKTLQKSGKCLATVQANERVSIQRKALYTYGGKEEILNQWGALCKEQSSIWTPLFPWEGLEKYLLDQEKTASTATGENGEKNFNFIAFLQNSELPHCIEIAAKTQELRTEYQKILERTSAEEGNRIYFSTNTTSCPTKIKNIPLAGKCVRKEDTKYFTMEDLPALDLSGSDELKKETLKVINATYGHSVYGYNLNNLSEVEEYCVEKRDLEWREENLEEVTLDDDFANRYRPTYNTDYELGAYGFTAGIFVKNNDDNEMNICLEISANTQELREQYQEILEKLKESRNNSSSYGFASGFKNKEDPKRAPCSSHSSTTINGDGKEITFRLRGKCEKTAQTTISQDTDWLTAAAKAAYFYVVEGTDLTTQKTDCEQTKSKWTDLYR